jgi:hypothetical protein
MGRLVTPVGVGLALAFMALGVVFLYQERSKLFLAADVVLFLFAVPTLCRWERPQPDVPPERARASGSP